MGDHDPRLDRLAEEQAALSRVATLVARGATPEEVFAAVSDEVGRLFDADAAVCRFEPDGSAMITVGLTEGVPIASLGSRVELEDFLAGTQVYRTGRVARIDAERLRSDSGPVAAGLRQAGFISTVGAPIFVEGQLWGQVAVADTRRHLPPDTEERIEKFTELVSMAIANAQSRTQLAQLADEQAALRRVATLIARGASPEEVFKAVSRELGLLLGAEAAILQFEPDGAGFVVVGLTHGMAGMSLGQRYEHAPFLVTTAVYEGGRTARSGRRQLNEVSGPLADVLRARDFISTVASPIIVQGHLWGAMAVADETQVLPSDTEDRLEKFTKLVATAIANTESRSALRRVADEQAALRRVAELVADGPNRDQVFSAASVEIARLFGSPLVTVSRFEPGWSALVIVGVNDDIPDITVGSRVELDDHDPATLVCRTRRPARRDQSDYEDTSGAVADRLRALSLASVVSAPIVVEHELWGVVTIGARHDRLPADTEQRLEKFTELLGTAVANSDTRRALTQLAEEQAALRRVATLVARGAPPDEVFSVVSNEIGRLFGAPAATVARFAPDGSGIITVGVSDGFHGLSVGMRWEHDDVLASTAVYRTGRSARKERSSFEHAAGSTADRLRKIGIVSSAAAPIIVEGQLWGTLTISDSSACLPDDAEARLSKFSELVATAIAEADSRAELAASEAHALSLAEEQAALRRVATLIAEGTANEELFAAVAREASQVTGVPIVGVCRYNGDGSFSVLTTTGEATGTAGRRWPVVHDIVVDGDIWGFIGAAATPPNRIPPGTETHLARFTGLVGTAISNSQARQHISQLADEQAALRRVATLVARGAPPAHIFSAVSEEVARLFGSQQAAVGRYEPDGSGILVVGVSGDTGLVSVGTLVEHEDCLPSTVVYRTGRAARKDDSSFARASGPMADRLREVGMVSGVAAPILVEGRLWGVVSVTDAQKRLPADVEGRLEKFTELVATAIANAQNRAELAMSEAQALKLAEEQAALRRVATLIAEAAAVEEIGAAVAAGVAQVLDATFVTVRRYDAETVVVLGSVGSPIAPGDLGSAVGVPIVVEGRIWGSINAASAADEMVADAEERIARFSDLVAAWVSNAAIDAELAASRARVIAAADESRRRIERDLHDGAQQELVTLSVALHRAQAKIPHELDDARATVGRVAEGLGAAIQDLRDLSRGIHPAILTEGGLTPALKALGRRSSVRVKLDIQCEARLPDPVEVAAYYIVSEALTNAAKHSGAPRVWVAVRVQAGTLALSVRDDGKGGADPTQGTGLIGLRDRVEALGGSIVVESPMGGGTRIGVKLPLSPPSG